MARVGILLGLEVLASVLLFSIFTGFAAVQLVFLVGGMLGIGKVIALKRSSLSGSAWFMGLLSSIANPIVVLQVGGWIIDGPSFGWIPLALLLGIAGFVAFLVAVAVRSKQPVGVVSR